MAITASIVALGLRLKGAAGLLFLICALFVGCSSGEDGETNASACDGTVSQVQDLVAELINEVPGFAGCEPDPENPGGYVVHVTSPLVEVEAVRDAITSYDQESEEVLGDADLRPVQIDVSKADTLSQEVPPRLLTELPPERRPEWQWFSADFDEVHNQVVILYGDDEARAWAQELILSDVEAPPGLIVAAVSDPGQDD